MHRSSSDRETSVAESVRFTSPKRDPDSLLWGRYDFKWTYLDQLRLNSLDGLAHRSLEFHNLNHSFRVVDDVYEVCSNKILISTTFSCTNLFHPFLFNTV
jgi:hypothetical protein